MEKFQSFSLDRGDLRGHDNLYTAEKSYKQEREKILDNIINNGKAVDSFEERERYRQRLGEKIKEGFLDREYLLKYHWPEDRILITAEIVDFLLPQIETSPIQNMEFSKPEIPMPDIKHIKAVILPSQKKETSGAKGESDFKEKRLIPRFETLIDFLDKNGIKTDEYICYEGENPREMMRGQSYIMFVLPGLKKMVLVCDEEGNATYIIHTSPNQEEFEKLKKDEEMDENERSPKFYYQKTKSELQILGKKLGIISWAKWDERNWLTKIENELTKDFDKEFSLKNILEIFINKTEFLENTFNQEELKPLSLENLDQNPELLKSLVEQIKGESVGSSKTIIIPGYENISINTFLQRISNFFKITLSQVRDYLIIWQEQDREEANEKLKEWQKK